MTEAGTAIEEKMRETADEPTRAESLICRAVHERDNVSVRGLALYMGLIVLLCQLVFVYAFFPSFETASEELAARQLAASTHAEVAGTAIESRYSRPDLLQWSGAQSLVWIASLFAPDTPVRFAPALIFFLVAGGFLAATYRPAQPGNMPTTVAAAARTGMRVWLSWFAGAAILVVYIVTSSGGMKALGVSAGITFERSWKDISDAFLSHWLVYIAWFAALGFLPMAGGAILGLIRTRFLTRAVPAEQTDERRASGPDAGEGRA